jgi:hypothetical protein
VVLGQTQTMGHVSSHTEGRLLLNREDRPVDKRSGHAQTRSWAEVSKVRAPLTAGGLSAKRPTIAGYFPSPGAAPGNGPPR